MVVTMQPRIVTRGNDPTHSMEKDNRAFPACFYKLSPEAWFCITGVVLLPFLIPVANFILDMGGLLFETWCTMVGSGALTVFQTTTAFLKLLGMGCVILMVVLSVLYFFYVDGQTGKEKKTGVIVGFGDFCLSIAYTLGVPVPGTILNFLSTDGR